MSTFEEEEEAFEHTLLVVREVSVYKIPPRSTNGGYKCGEWLQSDKIWSGRLRVVSCRERCEIRLENPNGGCGDNGDSDDRLKIPFPSPLSHTLVQFDGVNGHAADGTFPFPSSSDSGDLFLFIGLASSADPIPLGLQSPEI